MRRVLFAAIFKEYIRNALPAEGEPAQRFPRRVADAIFESLRLPPQVARSVYGVAILDYVSIFEHVERGVPNEPIHFLWLDERCRKGDFVIDDIELAIAYRIHEKPLAVHFEQTDVTPQIEWRKVVFGMITRGVIKSRLGKQNLTIGIEIADGSPAIEQRARHASEKLQLVFRIAVFWHYGEFATSTKDVTQPYSKERGMPLHGLSRHQFFRRPGTQSIRANRSSEERRIRSMAQAIHVIAITACRFATQVSAPCRAAVAGCVLLFAAGCATDPVPMGSRFVVAAPFAEFYKHGPAQDVVNLDVAQHRFDNYVIEQQTGPDFQLPKGTVVTMLKREAGYSKVITDFGVAGYVPNDKLKPAPPVARVAPTEGHPERNLRERMRAIPPSRQKQEQLDLSDIPLPLPS